VFDKLSRDGLRILAKSPEEVVRKLSGAMESVSRALVVQPNFGAAWMLKGRLHWSLMEFEPATESFRQAANLASAEQSPSGPDAPREVLALAESLPKAGVDRYLKAADILAASSLPQNATAGNILKLLSRKPTLRKSTAGAPGPLRRSFTANEIAVELIRRNGMQTRVFFKGTNSDQIDVIIWGSPELRDLSPLREIDVSGLALVGARTLDWQTIYSLPMERLDFSKCSIESFPQGPRGLPRVRSLKLADSEIASADFARSMPLLESLDLSSTHITDLSPLASCRRLRYLDLAGLNPANMRILMTLPIESLTVSPMLITDKSSLNALRYHRTLNILRAPGDPPAQPASDFWRKLESGKYNQIQ
ncbi:MAG TPA: leucine-rich repeat domain-containing protein, partial [Terrimicrobiaceae bacterium]